MVAALLLAGIALVFTLVGHLLIGLELILVVRIGVGRAFNRFKLLVFLWPGRLVAIDVLPPDSSARAHLALFRQHELVGFLVGVEQWSALDLLLVVLGLLAVLRWLLFVLGILLAIPAQYFVAIIGSDRVFLDLGVLFALILTVIDRLLFRLCGLLTLPKELVELVKILVGMLLVESLHSHRVLARISLQHGLVEPGGAHGRRVVQPDDEENLEEDVERDELRDDVEFALALLHDAVDDPVGQPLPVVLSGRRLHGTEAHEYRIG